MSKELTVTEERVREAASKCAEARRVLETLFPEVFSPPKKFVGRGTRARSRMYPTERYVAAYVPTKPPQGLWVHVVNGGYYDDLRPMVSGSLFEVPDGLVLE